MKKIYFLAILFPLAFFLFVASFIYLNSKEYQLVSPVLGVFDKKIAENVWLPKDFEQSSSTDKEVAQKISANAAFFMEMDSGQVLFAKNPYEKYSIASLTKIMAVIVALEHEQSSSASQKKSLDKIYSVSERAANMEPDKMLLIAGEKMSLEELLYGIFLVSANDASEVLAEGSAGSREEFTSSQEGRQSARTEFIDLMNKKAIQLGMMNTHFVNPSGLEEDFNPQYSTAFDVALMSRYAIVNYPKLLEISSTPHIYIERTSNHQDYDLYSGINLLTTYPGVLGFKTGYTPEAGLTLVTVAKKGGKTVLGVLLGSTNRRDDAKLLLDYSFTSLGI